MSNINTKTPAYLVFAADLSYSRKVATDFKRDALLIKNDDFGTCTPSFHLLSSVALELFPKVLIGYQVCLRYKDDHSVTEDMIREEISAEMQKYGHNIQRLYLAFPDLINILGLKKISSFKNGFVWDYRIELIEGSRQVPIIDIEAIRYGSFAKSRHLMTWCVGDLAIIDLLNKVEKYVAEKEKETNKEFKK